MSLMLRPLWRYADFNGRASRTEFWLFQLFLALLYAAFFIGVEIADVPGAYIANADLTGVQLGVMYGALVTYLALFIPRIALMVRRLHDSDNSGAWVLAGFVPGGVLILLVLSFWPGTVGPNRHGEDPRGRAAPTTRQATMTLDSVA